MAIMLTENSIPHRMYDREVSFLPNTTFYEYSMACPIPNEVWGFGGYNVGTLRWAYANIQVFKNEVQQLSKNGNTVENMISSWASDLSPSFAFSLYLGSSGVNRGGGNERECRITFPILQRDAVETFGLVFDNEGGLVSSDYISLVGGDTLRIMLTIPNAFAFSIAANVWSAENGGHGDNMYGNHFSRGVRTVNISVPILNTVTTYDK